MDHMRKLIANHMRESIDVSAHVYVMSEIDMTNIVNFVKKEDKVFNDKEGYTILHILHLLLMHVLKHLGITLK